ANRGSACAMVVGLTMGKVESNHIHAIGDDLFEHAWRIGGGTERGDDSGAAGLGFGSHQIRLPELSVPISMLVRMLRDDFTQTAVQDLGQPPSRLAQTPFGER